MLDDIDNLTRQIVSLYSPQKILLFGSQAKGAATEKSDIDLCIVMEITDETSVKRRKLLAEMYLVLETDIPVDILLYTPPEWEQCISDRSSMAYKINAEGVRLYG